MTDWLTVDNLKAVGIALFTAAAALWGNSALRRRMSLDKVVLAENDSERSAIGRLEAEIVRREAERVELVARNDRLQEERNAAVMENGALRQNVLTLSLAAERLEREVAALRGQIANLMTFHGFGIKPVLGDESDG